MSLRDYFAGLALGPVLAGASSNTEDEMVTAARVSYAIADAMLAERLKQKPE